MGWIQTRLGYGKWGFIDADDPSNPPQVVGRGLAINKVVFTDYGVVSANGGFSFNSYIPVTTGKVRQLTVTGLGNVTADIRYGVNGVQTIIAHLQCSASHPTVTLRFPDYILVDSTQIFQITVVNNDTVNLGITSTFLITE